jgi:syntaxin 18
MMDVRLTREVERNRSVLAKAGGPSYADFAAATGLEDGMSSSTGSLGKGKRDGPAGGRSRALIEEEEREKQRRMAADVDFTPEELQMFAKGNQAMMEHYETTLDKVKYVVATWMLLSGCLSGL